MKTPVIIPKPSEIRMTKGCCSDAESVVYKVDSALGSEAYRLTVGQDGIFIESSCSAGEFYAEKTLEQLKFQYGDRIPCMVIDDAPKYAYRSFHFDSARHFIELDELKKNIDLAASFKYNYFHFHFSDDQGYRIESLAFPLLTEISTKRKGDTFGAWNTDEEYQHWYTQDEIRELAAFCEERHIEIVPELDIPGHTTAVLAAYPELSCSGEPVEVITTQGIFSTVMCPGKEGTFSFIETLLDELMSLFPGRYFHIGGDEVPKTNWKTCPACRKRIENEHLKDEKELQGYMMNRVARYLKENGRTAIVWNEAAAGGNLDSDIVVQMWMEALGSRGAGAKHIAKGGKVINSGMMFSYCDYPNAQTKPRKMYETDLLPKGSRKTAGAADHVMGSEALLWTEHIRTPEELEAMAWPRYAIKAESIWSGPCADKYAAFEKRLKALYPYMRTYGIAPSPFEDLDPGLLKSVKQMRDFNKKAKLSKALKHD